MTQGRADTENYSVLMCVYHRENPLYLQESVQSMLRQSAPADDFVLVCDGELTSELNDVIKYFEERHDIFNVIRLPENRGIENALNVGLRYCKNSLIARMDSDDIAYTDRCELQLECFKHGVDIVSGYVEEFDVDTDDISAVRVLPEKHKDILKFAKQRNPFNHPCVMYRKEKVLQAGSYHEFYLYEDYHLWIRMLKKGAVGYNLQRPLLYMRAGDEMYRRRGGFKYFLSSQRFQKYLYDSDVTGILGYLCNTSIRFVMQVIFPNRVRKFVFRIYARN
jgi:glycosyltransferase involved in cell wall biosynthesis